MYNWYIAAPFLPIDRMSEDQILNGIGRVNQDTLDPSKVLMEAHRANGDELPTVVYHR